MKTSNRMQDVQTGLQRGRSERKPEAYSVWYAEDLSDTRMKLKACFNIRLKVARHV